MGKMTFVILYIYTYIYLKRKFVFYKKIMRILLWNEVKIDEWLEFRNLILKKMVFINKITCYKNIFLGII